MGREPTRGTRQPTRPSGWGVPLGIGVGAGLGLIVGILIGQLALGLAIGGGAGVVVGAASTALDEVPPEQRPRIIATAATILVAGIVVSLLVVLSP